MSHGELISESHEVRVDIYEQQQHQQIAESPLNEVYESPQPSHLIEAKLGHSCNADCPEHIGSHDGHAHAEEHQFEPRTIVLKSHCCGADCDEHGGHTHRRDHEQLAEPGVIELKKHVCAADCSEHGGSHHDHGHDHERFRSPQSIEIKAHSCSADCPEHGDHNHQSQFAGIPNEFDIQKRILDAERADRENHEPKFENQSRVTVEIQPNEAQRDDNLGDKVFSGNEQQLPHQSPVSDQIVHLKPMTALVANSTPEVNTNEVVVVTEEVSPVIEKDYAPAPEVDHNYVLDISTERPNDTLEVSMQCEIVTSAQRIEWHEPEAAIIDQSIETEELYRVVTAGEATRPLVAIEDDGIYPSPDGYESTVNITEVSTSDVVEIPLHDDNWSDRTRDGDQLEESITVPSVEMSAVARTELAAHLEYFENSVAEANIQIDDVLQKRVISLLTMAGFAHPERVMQMYIDTYGQHALEQIMFKLAEIVHGGRLFETVINQQMLLQTDDTMQPYHVRLGRWLLSLMNSPVHFAGK